jgi:hypothetical protein
MPPGVVDRNNIGMIERREQLGFALKTVQPVGIVREGLGKNLERDLAIQSGVVRFIHLSHAAGAHQRQQLVRAHQADNRNRHR